MDDRVKKGKDKIFNCYKIGLYGLKNVSIYILISYRLWFDIEFKCRIKC